MAGPKDGGGGGSETLARETRERVRQPAVAGMFYPAPRDACLAEARELMTQGARAADVATNDLTRIGAATRAAGARGGIVPHAGWVCSGAIAAESIAAIDKLGVAAGAGAGGSASAGASKPDVVVVFGAVHTPLEIEYAALDTHATWAEPFERSRVVAE